MSNIVGGMREGRMLRSPYEGTIDADRGLNNISGMLKHAAATFLWFTSMWALGAEIDIVTGLSSGVLAPALGLIAGVIAAIDPLHLFRRPSEGVRVTAATTARGAHTA